MKDWKFLQVGNQKIGNSYTKGQVLAEVNGRKYVFGGEINGTYLVHIQPSGKTYSFSSEQEIKDWLRNSKIGNESVKETNISGKNGSGVITRMNNLYFVAYNLSNGEKGIEKFTTESQAKDFLKKKVGNAKRYMSGDAIKVTLPGGRVIQAIVTKDEGNVIKYVTKIDDDGNPIGSEQIALRSEVGNAIIDYSVISTKDGYFVFKKNEKVGGPFQNEEQAKAFAARLQTKDPQWTNAKTGNEETKVDNLKRARNAMNKKTGNADVTLWNGNDSAYIKEDGTVLYLESNAFETDRDKYESQEVAIRELAKKGYIKK